MLFKGRPLLARFVVVILIPLLVFSLLQMSRLFDSLPEKYTDIVISSISQQVSISRDAMGYVNVSAKNDGDLFFGIGFAQAQDRLWQLEVQRRIARGTLSEVFGRNSIDHDIWLRTLGLYQSANFAWQALSPEAKMSLQAFSDGVNAYIQQQSSLPPEFILFDIDMAPWSPIDSLAWIKVFALNLSGNYRKELENQAVASVLTSKRLASLYPAITENSVFQQQGNDTLLTQATELERLTRLLQETLHIGGKYVGSNAWAVSGKHTSNGKALLANDPHLGLQVPSLWYGASLNSSTLHAKGMTLVGLPVIIFGRNNKISWAGTNLMADVQDLAVEQVKVNSPDHYLRDGEWQTMNSRIEHIAIRNDFPDFLRKQLKPLELHIRSTKNGPLVSDVQENNNQVMSLRWTALAEDDTSYQTFYDINYAQDWLSFNQAANKLVAPALNLLYSDTEGNIGLRIAGRIPIRNSGNGSLPVPGWSSEFDWQGYIPATELPQIYNPESGIIVSANNRAFADDYPHLISHDFAPEARASRITEVLTDKLKNGKTLTVQDSIDLQGDTMDLAIQSVLPILKSTQCKTEIQCQAMEYLHGFEGDMRADQIAPTIVSVWLEHLKIGLFRDDFKHYWLQNQKASLLSAAVANISIEQIIIAFEASHHRQHDWCDNIQTDVIENCQMILLSSLSDSIKELKKLAGSDMDDWYWGEIHHALYRHMPMSEVKLLQIWFEQTAAAGGSENSVNVANASYDPSQGYLQTFGAGFRQIMSMTGDDTGHLVMNSTGQSGHFLSRNFADAVPLFHSMQFHQLKFQEHETAQRVTLSPQ